MADQIDRLYSTLGITVFQCSIAANQSVNYWPHQLRVLLPSSPSPSPSPIPLTILRSTCDTTAHELPLLVHAFSELRAKELPRMDVAIASPEQPDSPSMALHLQATESMFFIPSNGDLGRRKVRSWNRGKFLGRGSFGVVFEGISNYNEEIALLSRLKHNNIVQYYGTDKDSSKLYLFLELVSQGSLASLYQKYRLRNSHVSRDAKCANILVDANGSVKLADFGLAKEVNKFSVLKSCQGSAYWMAPEVVNPRMTYGTSADIWSLGCTVLEMLTRQLPYPDMEWTQALFTIGRGTPPVIPKYLSKEARDFISQCLRPNPDHRPSASKLLDHPFVNRSLRSIMSIMTSSR
uniref:Protein kinase domain-containing protein n=1 Tax=Leersia perrieri TaxID=77586 RepID=A0A0D9W3E8_9ORYZ